MIKVKEILFILEQIIELLEQCNDIGWKNRFIEIQRLISSTNSAENEKAIKDLYIMISYNGVGGFLTDFVIDPANGHTVKNNEIDLVNRNIKILGSDLLKLFENNN